MQVTHDFPTDAVNFLEHRLADLNSLALGGDAGAAVCAEAVREVLNRLAAITAAQLHDALDRPRGW